MSCEKEKYIYAKKMCMGCYGRAQKGKTNETKKNKRVGLLNNELSEIAVYNEIWSERVHRSEVSGEPLLPKGHPMWHWQFMHCAPKSIYNKFRLRKDNIVLGTPDEHILQTRTPWKTKKDTRWDFFWEKYDKMKSEYSHLDK